MTSNTSITLSSFRNIREPLERTLERLTRQKYDAVEMLGGATQVRPEECK